MPYPEDQLRELLATNSARVIHYACESWFSVSDRPVTITCIAICSYPNKDESVFSLTDHQTDPEKSLLTEFYAHLQSDPDARYIHWNMNSSEFGFDAIARRYRFLFHSDPPVTVPHDRRYDLDDLIAFRYGANFADHPRLASMATLNDFKRRYFLSGKDEADRYAEKKFSDIRRSTTEKTYLIRFLYNHLRKGSLETKFQSARTRFAHAQLDALEVVTSVGARLHTVSAQLARRHANRATLLLNDEYDTQDLVHGLLRIFFEDVRAEEWTPSYAGGNKRVDFFLADHGVAVELKKSRPSMTAKSLGDELVIDIANYSRYPKIRSIACLVFDRDRHIGNPVEIENDLSYEKDSMRVVTRVYQS